MEAVADALDRAFCSSPLVCWFSKPDAPAAPDYAGAARAQGGANVQAAIANALLSQRTQQTPYGTLSFEQTGSATVPGAEGNAPVTIPTFTSNVALSPEGQQLFDADTRQRLGLAALGEQTLGQTQDALGSPIDLSGISPDFDQQVADSLYSRSTRYLDPQWQEAEAAERTRLANQGFSVGAEGYENALDSFNRRRELAYGGARESATAAASAEGVRRRQQDIAELLLRRSLPLSELNALRTGAAPQMPSFSPMSGGGIAPAPVFESALQQQQALDRLYNADVGMYNSNMSGLYGLGSAALLALL